ncbi:MAG TPA: hypothetical protein VHB21_21530 [Minicystis sp.]|nr:hypothetical protein [Minicystis sp.]
MRALKFAAPIGVVVLSLAGAADAKVSYLTLQNNEAHPVNVDWRLTKGNDCEVYQKSGTVTIGAKTVQKFEIVDERLLCLKLHGVAMSWRREPLKQGSDTLVVVK